MGQYPVVEVSSLKSCLYVDCSSSQENVEAGCTFSVSSAMNSLDGGFDQRKSVQTIGKNGSCLSTFAKHCTLCTSLIIIDHHFTSHFACPEVSGTALTCQSSLKVDGSHATALPLELLGLLGLVRAKGASCAMDAGI